MNAALIVGLAALLISCGHCRPQVTSSALQGALEAVKFLTMSSIQKRQSGITFGNCDQNELTNIFQNYPRDCLSALSNLDLRGIQNANIDAITAAYRIICQPRCGNPIITFYNRCGFSQFTGIVRGLCSSNSAGTSCYEEFGSIVSDGTQVTSNCNFQSSTCTAACQNALTNYGRSGCCINVFNTTSLTGSTPAGFQNSLWSGCGVSTPEFCNLATSSLSSADAPKTLKVLFMLTLVAMAMLLL